MFLAIDLKGAGAPPKKIPALAIHASAADIHKCRYWNGPQRKCVVPIVIDSAVREHFHGIAIVGHMNIHQPGLFFGRITKGGFWDKRRVDLLGVLLAKFA